jgi:hypothetical protein
MNVRIFLLMLLATGVLCLAEDSPSPNKKRTWGRTYIGEALGDGKDKRLELTDVDQELVHLIGVFVLTREVNGEVPQLVVQGHLGKTGVFAANVSLEVSNDEKGDWKTIETSLSDKIELTLTAAPHVAMLFIPVQLDAFQSYIGKFKFGRVTLQTGESDVFPMAWLTEEGK